MRRYPKEKKKKKKHLIASQDFTRTPGIFSGNAHEFVTINVL